MIERRQSLLMDFFTFQELVFHTVVREVRHENSRNPVVGLFMAASRTLLMVGIFYVMFEVLGARSAMIRGDAVLYLVSGFLLFFLHVGAISGVLASGSSVGALQQHAPVTPALMIVAGAIKQLYLHVFALGVILLGLFVFKGEIDVYNWGGLIAPFMLTWLSGVSIGLLFLGVKPFAPDLVKLLATVYQRANFFTSGKFFVANMLPAAVIPFFAWNPLFHCIDQMRGAMFVNYVPQNSNLEYPTIFCAVGLVIGMMLEFFTRKTVSRSSAHSR
ncbi:ABC transporter permease [Algicella marina]|nr:ABC transporter permease [Algicella marina]